MEERELYSNTCNDCGKVFFSKGKIKIKLCEECKNRKNGTCLTYGQYSLLTETQKSGIIKAEAPKADKLSFKIDYPPKKTEWTKEYGLNRYYSGKHWAQRQADADYWHELTGICAKGLPMMKEPCIITFYFNDGLDISNHAAMAKMIEDGLKGRVIQDDNRKWVKGHEYYFHDKDYILVEIRAAGE